MGGVAPLTQAQVVPSAILLTAFLWPDITSVVSVCCLLQHECKLLQGRDLHFAFCHIPRCLAQSRCLFTFGRPSHGKMIQMNASQEGCPVGTFK